MKRRTLDILFSIGGLGLAVLLLVVGIVLTANANFANDYVRDQLSEQNIRFAPAESLSEEEKKADCLVENAGKLMTTGKQAECYANEYIGSHLKSIAGGQTYAALGGPEREIQGKIEAARAANDPALPELEKQLAQIKGQRDTVFKGETLRGLLLTSYGFSEFGVKAQQGALAMYLGSGLLFLLSIAGFVHAARTPENEAFAAPKRDRATV
ncbi:hypothetical protein [Micromonospora sagamiensis]|uniref:Uncharacterized protein n=1 Tax=Micromonospora sagamiensis TaxID=47875 RepID=A0A562WL85_9ACTN|nr:hypothetical protein [Micromonospora sagamiensis]TWJ31059.1 hypothetical protein JD81_04611 [Micromonospora sagamiensis]BCL15899.1 hypothetical protein GCM10017556_36380 [Micromonospora sagamiensis]